MEIDKGTSLTELPCGICISRYEDSIDQDLLRKHNVKAIVRVLDFPLFEFPGINYYTLKIEDDPKENLLIKFDEICDWIHDRFRTRSTRVLIHCRMGRSRSATICTAYLMKYGGYNLADAIKEMERCIGYMDYNPNPGFMMQLEIYGILLSTK